MVKAKIELDLPAIRGIAKQATEVGEITMELLRGEVASAAVMPFRGGNLQNGGTYVSASGVPGATVSGNVVEVLEEAPEGAVISLTNDAPQARRLYHHPEYDYFQGENANAGGAWLESWISGDKKDYVPDEFAKLLKERLDNA